jgi:hypothetical protein
LEAVPLQEPWVVARVGAPSDDVGLLLRDGTVLRGAAVYRWLLRRRWWGIPLWLLASVPPSRWLFDLGYRLVARNRHRLGRACRLQPPPARDRGG